MKDLRDTGSAASDGQGENRGTSPGASRWVRVLGLVFFVVLVLFIALYIAGDGFRGHPPPVT